MFHFLNGAECDMCYEKYSGCSTCALGLVTVLKLNSPCTFWRAKELKRVQNTSRHLRRASCTVQGPRDTAATRNQVLDRMQSDA